MALGFGVAVNAIAGLLQALFRLSDLVLDVGDPMLAAIVAVGSPDGHGHRDRASRTASVADVVVAGLDQPALVRKEPWR